MLARLYQDCEFLVYPSLFEGFGIPLVEAMSFEKPMIVANTGSLPEVAGDAALYFDPERPVELAEAFWRLDSEPELRDKLVANGRQRLNLFAPAAMVEAYNTLFRQILQQNEGKA